MLRGIPTSFQLAGRTWEVTVVDDLEGDDGEFIFGRANAARARIELAKNQSPECAAHTFYHELVHAIAATLGYSRLNNDESKVDAIGNLLLQFEQTRVDP